MTWIAGLFLAWLILEAALWGLVKVHRPRFKWLIRPCDTAPTIPSDLVDKYVRLSYDPELGWLRKPNTSGTDQTAEGPKAFHINSTGRRFNPYWDETPERAAVFGDSYAFCRLVNDDETWPHQLSNSLGVNVANFGVGNYGCDQALLRFRRELPRIPEAKIIILALVPETMARIHSYWRHFYEYGNILAFKPRFSQEGNNVTLHPSAIQKAEDFRHYSENLDMIKSIDAFFYRKFSKDLIRFPYSACLIRRGRRLGLILWHLTMGWLRAHYEEGAKRAFQVVLRENIRENARLYGEDGPRRLLKCLLREFVEGCNEVSRNPLIVILPQPADLEGSSKSNQLYYQQFFSDLSRSFPVLDLTGNFLAYRGREKLYIEGPLGPHTSAVGNRMIAGWIAEALVARGYWGQPLNEWQAGHEAPTGGKMAFPR